MIDLTLSEAFEFVRKSLDELDMSDNLAASILEEDKDLYALVESTIEEVALDIHQSAPAHLVDGLKAESDDEYDDDETAPFSFNIENSVGTISMEVDCARVVSIKASGSHLVTEFFTEDSVEAHKQKNKYIMGTPDRPRAILCKRGGDFRPTIEYYSFGKEELVANTITVEYIPYPKVKDGVIKISYQLKYPLLYWLVAAILEIVNEPEKAQLWKAKFKVE